MNMIILIKVVNKIIKLMIAMFLEEIKVQKKVKRNKDSNLLFHALRIKLNPNNILVLIPLISTKRKLKIL